MIAAAYARGRARALWAEDLFMIAAAIVGVVWMGEFGRLVAAGIVIALAWSVVTLHHPARAACDDAGLSFARYGRAHRFAWDATRSLSVRRFVTKDRVLVRVSPAPPWRGRYWLHATMDGFAALVAELERRASTSGNGQNDPGARGIESS